MISIITAIYNQIDMNRLFWKYLLKYTDSPFELIIIDNASTDGSREFFQSLSEYNVKVVANDANYSYPHCQNQGIALAKHEILVFLNNDLLVSAHWDTRLLELLGKDKCDVLSFATSDRMCDATLTKRISRKWKRIKYPLIAIFGQRLFALKLMVTLCYGNWEKYTEKIFHSYGYSLSTGFSGSAIAMTRRALELLGKWDITQQGADFDLFYRSCFRAETYGDIKPISILNGVFMHHYRRLTLYAKNRPPFKDGNNLTSISSKWKKEQMDLWNRYINFECEYPDFTIDTNATETHDYH
ncbi:MAG: glycosyltransferase [Prevotellaceae bacterium]|jgi:glycosyltransferase involved in cell wall biosynthesis|nr:glycosyltransferase [Prevotellaceae bacterium]